MRKFYDVEHNSDEWFELRLGLFTASSFDKLVTKESNKGYIDTCKKVAFEKFHGKKPEVDEYKSFYMNRGHELEEEAAQCYELHNDCECIKAGFGIFKEMIGASPDRLVLNDDLDRHGVEIKCPAYNTMFDYLEDPNKLKAVYTTQCRVQMLVYDIPFVDLVAYHPDFPLIIQKIERDYEEEGFLIEKAEKATIMVNKYRNLLIND